MINLNLFILIWLLAFFYQISSVNLILTDIVVFDYLFNLV